MLPGFYRHGRRVRGNSAAGRGHHHGGIVLGGSHRYWRILATANNTASTISGLVELQMFSGASGMGNNVCVGGTAIKDTQFDTSHPATGAFDQIYTDNATHVWASENIAFPHYIGYDFGSNVAVTGFTINPGDTQTNLQAPRDFTFEYSDNGSTWTTWTTYTGRTYTNYEMRRFLLPSATSYTGSPHGLHRYWRFMYMEAENAGGISSATTLEWHSTPGGSNVATGGTPFDDGHTSIFVIGNAYDGVSATFFASSNFYCGYDFGSAVSIAELSWRNREDSFATQAPKTGYMQFSDDNTNWTTAWDVLGQTSWTLGQTRLFTDPYYI